MSRITTFKDKIPQKQHPGHDFWPQARIQGQKLSWPGFQGNKDTVALLTWLFQRIMRFQLLTKLLGLLCQRCNCNTHVKVIPSPLVLARRKNQFTNPTGLSQSANFVILLLLIFDNLLSGRPLVQQTFQKIWYRY